MVTDRNGRRWWGFVTPPLVFAISLSFAEMKHLMNSLWCMPQEGKNVVWSWYDATAGFAWKRLNCNMLPKSTPLPLVCPMAKVLVMSTCKIHFIRSPGAIIAVVQTPAKNPEVRIWKYLSKKLIHYIVILYYYAYYAFHEKWTCTVDGKNKQEHFPCINRVDKMNWFVHETLLREETIKSHTSWMDVWVDGRITTPWKFKANKC